MDMHVPALETAGVWRGLRTAEKVTSTYFLHVSIAAVLSLTSETPWRFWCVNLLLGALLVWISQHRAPSLRDRLLTAAAKPELTGPAPGCRRPGSCEIRW